jgi:putative transposase
LHSNTRRTIESKASKSAAQRLIVGSPFLRCSSMARPARICFPGALYHVIARGNAREPVVRDDEDRTAFIDIVERVVERYALVLYAYCLMSNHYHLAVETPLANLPIAMRQLNGLYANRFNRRYDRVGHVFQARYRGVLIERESYLLNVCRYVVRNPVRADICADPAEYRWSSYRQTAGLAHRDDFLASDAVLSFFGRHRAAAQRSYREFVAAADPDLDVEVVGERLGSESFLQASFTPEPIPEVPRAQWQPVPPTLADIFATDTTPVATAYRRYGYSLADIAAHVGRHYATVSRRLRAEERGVAVKRPTSA